MDYEHSLCPKSAQRLREAANVAARMEEQCLATYASALERNGSPQRSISPIAEDLDGFKNSLRALLADPHLQPWMDGSDRVDLYALSNTFGSFRTFAGKKTEAYRRDVWGAYRDIFASTRSNLRMAGVLLQGTIGNQRHRPDYTECQARTTIEPTSAGDVRLTLQRELDALSAIDEVSFIRPWRELDYRSMKDVDCMFWATVRDDRPLGSLIAECYAHTLHVPRFSVDPAERKQGVGSRMFGKLLDKILREYPRRRRLLFTVPETALEGLAYVKHRGCTVVARIPAGTEDGEDTILCERMFDQDRDAALLRTTERASRAR